MEVNTSTNQPQEAHWTRIPDALFQSGEIDPIDFKVMSNLINRWYLFNETRKQETFYCLASWLAERVGVTERTITTSIKRLQGYGFIKVKRNRMAAYQYSLCWDTINNYKPKIKPVTKKVRKQSPKQQVKSSTAEEWLAAYGKKEFNLWLDKMISAQQNQPLIDLYLEEITTTVQAKYPDADAEKIKECWLRPAYLEYTQSLHLN